MPNFDFDFVKGRSVDSAKFFSPFLLAFLILITILSGQTEAAVRVCVSIPHMSWLIREVAGDSVQVTVLVEKGKSPATMEVTPSLMGRVGKSAVWFTTGVPFEQNLIRKVRGIFPKLKIIDCNEHIPLRTFEGRHLPEDSNAEPGEASCGQCDGHDHDGHDHQGKDPHVWLNPRYALLQARVMAQVLGVMNPSETEEYATGLAKLEEKLLGLDKKIAEMLAPFKGEKVMVFHPSFGYFCDAYHLWQMAIEFQGKEPSARYLSSLMWLMKKHRIRRIFIQPEFSSRAAGALAASVGAGVETLDPLSDNYPETMLDMAGKIAAALKEQTTQTGVPLPMGLQEERNDSSPAAAMTCEGGCGHEH